MKSRLCGILLLFFVFIGFSSQNQGKGSYGLSEFITDVYNQYLEDDQLLVKYKNVVAVLDAELEKNGADFKKRMDRAYADYYMARAYQAFDSVDVALTHDAEMRKGKYLSLIRFYNRKEDAIRFYNSALSQIDLAEKISVTSETIRLRADANSQLCLLTDIPFVLKHGPATGKLANKALEMDPKNTKAALLQSSSKVYPPPIYGGDADEGLKMLQEIQQKYPATQEELYNIHLNFGYCYIVKKNYTEAQKHLEIALKIYPGNIYANALYFLAKNKRG